MSVEFKFTPYTRKQINDMNLAPEGEYDFEIVKSIKKLSKTSHNPMIELGIRVLDQNGKGYLVMDYLLTAEAHAHKLFTACMCMNLEKKYTSGELEDIDFEGKVGRVKIGIQADKTGEYKDRNFVKYYIEPSTKVSASASVSIRSEEEVALDDDIPFDL